MDFLWHKVSDEEKREISEEAKNIMDSFSGKLSKIINKLPKEAEIERDVFEREEGKIKPVEIDRDILFDNAPEKNEDFIIAERKKW